MKNTKTWVLMAALSTLATLVSTGASADEFVGVLIGKALEGKEFAGVAGLGAIEAPNRPDPSDRRDHAKDAEYGHGHLRLEAGSGFGVNGDLVAGRALLNLKARPIGLHFGVEPANLHLSLNNDNDRTDYIEWQPSVSLGVQAESGTCHALAAVRGGASVGTLGDNGIRKSYGVGANLVCKGVKAAGEWTQIKSDTDHANIASFDFKRVKQGEYLNSYWGVRGEMINTRNDRALPDSTTGTQDKNEYRVLVTAGTAIF